MADIVRLGDYVDLLTGFPFKSAGYVDAGGMRLLRGDNVAQGRIRWDGAKLWPINDASDCGQYALRVGDVILAMDRPWIEAGLKYAQLRDHDVPSLLVQRVACLRARDGLDQQYLGYLIGSKRFAEYVLSVQTGTAVPHISSRQIADFKFDLPDLGIQRAVAQVLGALDDKIALNEQTALTVAEFAHAQFTATITAARRLASVGDVAVFHNRRRIPLSARQRSGMPGRYPYYGANGIVDYVGEFIFDGDYVLVGEDGTVVTGGGAPVVQDVHGKFWVNNHAHVLTGDSVSNEVLLMALKSADVRHLVTGAVQPKLSMGNLKKLPLALPSERAGSQLEPQLRELFNLTKSKSAESRALAELRAVLLPGLMSGAIRVTDAKNAVEEAT
ncbi:restriction endonuclease subunit S [Micromonospora echinofusca]|uniref:restriction endonuclease subunit S n=1 Tax=Micromonospora echinofusca TaxID=47858 RepID=UPI003406FB6F